MGVRVTVTVEADMGGKTLSMTLNDRSVGGGDNPRYYPMLMEEVLVRVGAELSVRLAAGDDIRDSDHAPLSVAECGRIGMVRRA